MEKKPFNHWHDAPKEIWLQVCPDADFCEVPFHEHSDVTWCQDQVYESDIKYARVPCILENLTDQEIDEIVDMHTTDDHGHDIWCNGKGVALAVIQAYKRKNGLK